MNKTHIQAFINNIAFPKTLDELWMFITEHGCFNVENILFDEVTEWTVPNWAKIGDVVFFMHTKTAKTTITRLRTQLKNDKEKYSQEKFDVFMEWIERGLSLYKKYGGKIYAIGIVTGKPERLYSEGLSDFHWHSRIFAKITIISLLENPLDISQFNDFITVSRQSGITPVIGNAYRHLLGRMAKNNEIPDILFSFDAFSLPFSEVTGKNWLKLSNEFRRSFFLELQFRKFYVNYLLKELGDQKKFFVECRCKKHGYNDSFADNVILLSGKFLPVEVKLSILTQQDIKGQVKQYCHTDTIFIDKNRCIYPNNIYNNFALVIDTDKIYLYDDDNDTISSLYKLDYLKKESDIEKVKNIITDKIKGTN